MSSCSQATVRAVTRPMVGAQAIDLTTMLGAKGCALVERTLAAEGSAWTRRAGGKSLEQTYSLQIRDGLPAGVSDASVTLRLRGGVAEVTRRWTYADNVVIGDRPGSVPQAVADTMRRLVTRAVNAAIVQTVSHALQVHMQQRIPLQRTQGLQHTVLRQLKANHQIQLSMRIRQGAGR